MIKQSKLKVKLISFTKDPEQIAAAAIRQCYSSVGARQLKKKISDENRAKLIKQVLASGHTSTLEHASFTFAIEGASRVTEIHLIRHRIASFSIQSGRYVKRSDARYVVPDSILKGDKKTLKEYLKHLKHTQEIYNKLVANGVPEEDARYCQPQSIQVKIVMTMNARSLLNFFHLRCCKRSQWETQKIANEMLKEVKKVAPNIFENAGPSCINEKVCWEGKMSCGLWKKINGAELRSKI